MSKVNTAKPFWKKLLRHRKPAGENAYWERRKDVFYYKVVRVLAMHIGKHSNSIIDIGSRGCPYLDWFQHIPNRTSIDLEEPYTSKGISAYTQDFLEWTPDRFYDIALCLQVLEHVPDAAAFAQKVLSVGRVAIISVPYKWKEDQDPEHVHDPVDRSKLVDWFGRPPNFEYVCREVRTPFERIIQVYDDMPEQWAALSKRDALLRNKDA